MDYTKQPLDYPQIISLLKQRNLLIDNEPSALEQLKIISYFRLANYLRPMEQDKITHIFKPNSHFENAIDLYYFDKKLRVLLFTAVQSFEVALRSKLIHHCSLKFGAFWIIERGQFADKKIFSDCAIRIQQEVMRSKEDFSVPRTDWWGVKIGKNRKVNCCVFEGWPLGYLLMFADVCSRCAT